MLFLIAIVLEDLRFQQDTIGLIFGFDEYSWDFLGRRENMGQFWLGRGCEGEVWCDDAMISCARGGGRATAGATAQRRGDEVNGPGEKKEESDGMVGDGEAYIEDLAGAETGAAVEPVIILQFVDLDSFATVGRLKVQRHDPAGKDRDLSRMSEDGGGHGGVGRGDVMEESAEGMTEGKTGGSEGLHWGRGQVQ